MSSSNVGEASALQQQTQPSSGHMSGMESLGGGIATTMPPKNSDMFRRAPGSDINISDGHAPISVTAEQNSGAHTNNMMDSSNNAGDDLALGMSGSGNSLGTFEPIDQPGGGLE